MSNKILIGSPKDFPAGKAKVVNANGTSIVVNHVDDKFYAVENRCAHLGFPLGTNRVEGTEIACPIHGSRYDMRTGENLDWVVGIAGSKLPDWSRKLLAMGRKPAPLKTFPVLSENGQLFIEM